MHNCFSFCFTSGKHSGGHSSGSGEYEPIVGPPRYAKERCDSNLSLPGSNNYEGRRCMHGRYVQMIGCSKTFNGLEFNLSKM